MNITNKIEIKYNLKIYISLFILLLFLNGCVQTTALLGLVYTLASPRNIYQAGLSYDSNQAV